MTIILFDDAYAIVNGDKIIPIKRSQLPIDLLLRVEKEGSTSIDADTVHNILYAR